MKTVDVIGARYVVLKSTGFASMRVTLILAFTSSIKKLFLFVIWKEKGGGAWEREVNVYMALQEIGVCKLFSFSKLA